MRRYPSLDVLRGLAIFMMVVFHVIMRWYDLDWLREGDIDGVPLIALLGMVIVIFFSAWAGFFLMVSAISNMVSMQRSSERGTPWKRLMMYQIGGGVLLLIAAILVESTIGYHGFLGELVKGNSDEWTMVLYRGYHMETIHTIALCIIVNGIVHALLMRNGGFSRVKRNIRVYGVLAALTIAMTGPVYWILRRIIPGYPVATWVPDIVGKEIGIQYAVIGESPVGDIVLNAIMMPLGAMPEPLFPYLAVSFIGSMIGIRMTTGKGGLKSIQRWIRIGVLVFIAGLVGTTMVLLSDQYSVDRFVEYFFQLPGLYPGAWLWWFLCLTGAQMAVVLLVIRMVEYRGKAREFGRRTLWIRRYGFVAFSIYTFQFIDVIPRLVFQLFPDISTMYPYPSRLSAPLCLMMIPMTILLWEIVLRTWERISFSFGMEWFIAKAAERLFPKKRKKERNLKWYEVSRLDPDGYLNKPEWIDAGKHDNSSKEDLRLSRTLILAGLIFYPISLLGLIVLKPYWNKGKDWRRTRYLFLIVSILLVVEMVILSLVKV